MNTEKMTEAILNAGVSAVAKEEGSLLVDHWITHNQADASWKIFSVEAGFVLWLDNLTAIIGAQDCICEEGGRIIGGEWKTSKEKDKYWNENAWLESISDGSQIAIYALALREGTYYEEGREPFTPRVSVPRIRVRAISKSNPPELWPTDPSKGIISFSDIELENVRNALLSKAAGIRGMKRAGVIPWQLPGIWCTNMFRRQCEHYSDCTQQIYPVTGRSRFDPNDPAAKLALPHINNDDPELVILSASSYGTASECAEKYRRNALTDHGRKEESLALDLGTVLHAGVAAWYKEIRSDQQNSLDREVASE